MGRHDDSDSDEMEWHPTKPFVMRASCVLRYGEEDAQVAVVTGTHPWHVVLVGGQGEGLMWAHYQRQLADACEAQGEPLGADVRACRCRSCARAVNSNERMASPPLPPCLPRLEPDADAHALLALGLGPGLAG